MSNALRSRNCAREGNGDYEYRVDQEQRYCASHPRAPTVAGIAEHFQGPTAIALSYGDPAGLAKILCGVCQRTTRIFELKGGRARGQRLSMPRRDRDARHVAFVSIELRGQIIGLLHGAGREDRTSAQLEPGAQLARALQMPGVETGRGDETRPRCDGSRRKSFREQRASQRGRAGAR